MLFNKRRNKHNSFKNGYSIDSDVENEKIDDKKDLNYNEINFSDKNRDVEIEKAVYNNFQFKKSPDEISSQETNETNNRIIFKSQIKRRGRKPIKLIGNKRHHEASDFDNIVRKIQTHFLNFIIFLLNEIAHTVLKNKKNIFQKLNYSLKKTVNFNYIQTLKGYTLRELISNINPSPKYKSSVSKNINKLYSEKFDKYDCFNHFFSLTLPEAFSIYYNQKKPLKSIVLGSQEIILPKDTKSFSYLLIKNLNNEKKIIEAAEKVYLSEFDSSNHSLDLNETYIKLDKKNPFKTILYN